MPIEEKLTVTGLPTTEVTRVGKLLSLMTAAPDAGAMAEICTAPPELWTVTSTLLFRFIAAIRANMHVPSKELWNR
jgi:hypothetical protein